MKKFIYPILFIAAIFLSACSDDEPVVTDNVVGSWNLQYPEGLQADGFVDWSFSPTGTLEIKVSSIFSGDHFSQFEYSLSEENKTLTISGDITDAEGHTVRDRFAVYDVVKLTKKELRIKQTWVNTSYTNYDNFPPENQNSFLLGGYQEETFRKGK